MKDVFGKIFGGRIIALFIKELRQIKRDRQLVVWLIAAPTMLILIFGFALDPISKNLRFGVVDESRTIESRELVAAFTANKTFYIVGYYASSGELEQALTRNELDAGLVVPREYAEQRLRRETAPVQLFLNAVNSNTAAIAQGYAAGIIGSLNQRFAANGLPPDVSPAVGGPGSVLQPLNQARVTTHTALLYNPGLVSPWYFATGAFGTMLLVNTMLISAFAMTREKEMGTLEQLAMTPASAFEIITAKIVPLFILLMGFIVLILVLIIVFFSVPVRGNLLWIFVGGALAILSAIGIGTMIATFTTSARQAELASFFVSPPLMLFAGAVTPIEALPMWMQPLTYLNPGRHIVVVIRSVLIKGAGLDVIYPHLLALLIIASVLISVSVWRFRRQIG